jgi:hypothetical protein
MPWRCNRQDEENSLGLEGCCEGWESVLNMFQGLLSTESSLLVCILGVNHGCMIFSIIPLNIKDKCLFCFVLFYGSQLSS